MENNLESHSVIDEISDASLPLQNDSDGESWIILDQNENRTHYSDSSASEDENENDNDTLLSYSYMTEIPTDEQNHSQIISKSEKRQSSSFVNFRLKILTCSSGLVLFLIIAFLGILLHNYFFHKDESQNFESSSENEQFLKQLWIENRDLKNENSQLRDGEKLTSLLKDRLNLVLSVNEELKKEIEDLRSDVCLTDLLAMKNNHVELVYENENLKLEIAKEKRKFEEILRSSEEREKINLLKTENEDLKQEVGKIRYGGNINCELKEEDEGEKKNTHFNYLTSVSNLLSSSTIQGLSKLEPLWSKLESHLTKKWNDIKNLSKGHPFQKYYRISKTAFQDSTKYIFRGVQTFTQSFLGEKSHKKKKKKNRHKK